MTVPRLLRRHRRPSVQITRIQPGPGVRPLLALPAPHTLPRRTPRRTTKLRPEEGARAWEARLQIMVELGNRCAQAYLRRLCLLCALRRIDAIKAEMDRQYLEAKGIVAAFEAMAAADTWAATEADDTTGGFKALVAPKGEVA